jgi:adenylate kinase
MRTAGTDHRFSGEEPIGETLRPYRLLMMGRQGSGKGTQCARLARILEITHIDLGDTLRTEVQRRSALGRSAERFLQEGRLVPDEIVLGIVTQRLGQVGSGGFILDGFPRTLPQAEALGEAIGLEGIDHVLHLVITPSEALQRLSARRVCGTCGAVTSLSAGVTACPTCQGPLVQREDDTVGAIKQRLVTYERRTRPVLDWYATQGHLVSVDGQQHPDAVTRALLHIAVREPGVLVG